MQELYNRPLIQKFWKYSMTSVVGVVMGQSLIFLFASVLDWSWGWANVAAVVRGARLVARARDPHPIRLRAGNAEK